MAPDGSSLLTSPAASVQTAPDGSRPIVGMIIGMIKAHPTDCRMARQANGVPLPPARDGCTYLRWWPLCERLASPTRSQTEDAIQRNPARLTRSPVLRLPLWGAASPGDSASTALPSSSQDEAALTSARCRARGVGSRNTWVTSGTT